MSKRPNKRRERAKERTMAIERQTLSDVSRNNIEQYNFNKLVRAGLIKEIQDQ